jgi:hypothetical protein
VEPPGATPEPAPDAPDAGARPPTSHRAPVPVHESVRRMVPPLAAVSAIVLVIVALLVLNRPAHHGVGAGPAVHPGPTHSSSKPERTAPPTTPSPTPSASPSAHRTVPVPQPSATAKPAVAKAPVTVLNNSRRAGLAHRAAAQVAGGGWPIADVGNFTGRIPVSTVYYARGQARVAQSLAHQFPAVRRVLPRFSGLPGSGLTLVVTRDWPA